MSEPLTAEELARQFHETYERLAPSFGYETRKASAVPWKDVPEQNKTLMVAVADEVLATLDAARATPALDVERLAMAIDRAWEFPTDYVEEEWLTSDGEPRSEVMAEQIAREYAALSSEPES